jgi:hypothetical protein
VPPWPSARDPLGAKEPPAGFSVRKSPERASSHYESPLFKPLAGRPHTRCLRMFSPAAGCFRLGDSVLGPRVVRSLQPSTSSLLDRSIRSAHRGPGAQLLRAGFPGDRGSGPNVGTPRGLGNKARIPRVLLANVGMPCAVLLHGPRRELIDPLYVRRPLRSVPLAPAGRPRGIDLTSDIAHGKQKGNQKAKGCRRGWAPWRRGARSARRGRRDVERGAPRRRAARRSVHRAPA